MSIKSLSYNKLANKSYTGSRSYTTTTEGDPYWGQVSMLLRGDGPNGGTNTAFLDNSTSNLTITKTGTPTQGSFSPFVLDVVKEYSTSINGGSCLFNGSSDYLSAPSSSVLTVGTSAFTIEFWVYKISNAKAEYIFGSATANVLQAGITTGGLVTYGAAGGASFTSTGAVPINTWTHVAIVRTSTGTNGTTFYINGLASGTATDIVNYSTNGAIQVGTTNNTTTYCLTGYLSNLRVVKSTAVYTSNFTPSTLPLTAITNTSLLLKLDNASIIDSTTKNIAILNANTATSTVVSKFGGSSIYFDGSSYITLAHDSRFVVGSADFTIEFWVYPTNLTGVRGIVTKGAGLQIYSSGTALYLSLSANNTTTYFISAQFGTLTLNTWQHIALSKYGTTYQVFIDGISQNSVTSSSNIDVGTGPLYIAYDPPTYYSVGYIDDFRFTKGIARYRGNFTVPTTTFPGFYSDTTTDLYWSQVSLLLHGDGANNANNNTFIDSSTNNFTLTKTGSLTQGTFSPFPVTQGSEYTVSANSGSISFDGTSSYLSAPSSSSFGFGTGDFTIELWVRPISQGGHGNNNNDCLVDFRNNVATSVPAGTLYLSVNGTNVGWFANNANLIMGSPIPNNVWTHIAVCRTSGSTRMFINGAQSGSTYSDAISYIDSPIRMGSFSDGAGAGYLHGSISNLRIIKGTALYTSTFTPPLAPLTNITNTSLLLKGENAAIYDTSAKTNLITVGNSATMVSVNKYGGSSIGLNGTTDYIYSTGIPQLQGGPFTVEAWLYPTQVSVGKFIFTQVESTSDWNATGYSFDCSTNTAYPNFELKTGAGTFTAVLSSIPLIANTWQHVAWCYDGTTARIFVNGIQGAATAVSHAANTAGTSIIGAGNGVSAPFAGYIDDLRVTKGSARYQSGFVPPMKSFPNK